MYASLRVRARRRTSSERSAEPQIDELRRQILRGRRACGETDIRNLDVVVWYERCECEAQTLFRVQEIERLPKLLQRGMIESMNPQWIDLCAMELGFPFLHCLSEKECMRHFHLR